MARARPPPRNNHLGRECVAGHTLLTILGSRLFYILPSFDVNSSATGTACPLSEETTPVYCFDRSSVRFCPGHEAGAFRGEECLPIKGRHNPELNSRPRSNSSLTLPSPRHSSYSIQLTRHLAAINSPSPTQLVRSAPDPWLRYLHVTFGVICSSLDDVHRSGGIPFGSVGWKSNTVVDLAGRRNAQFYDLEIRVPAPWCNAHVVMESFCRGGHTDRPLRCMTDAQSICSTRKTQNVPL